MKKPIQFRVFVDPATSPQWFDVVIHKNKKKLNKERWRGRKQGVYPDCEAYFSPNNSWLQADCECGTLHRKNMPLVGTLHFHRECLGYGLVAHESFHAVMAWAVEVGANPVCHEACLPDSNEICAGLIGRMVAAIIDQMEVAGLKIINM